jgi:integrase
MSAKSERKRLTAARIDTLQPGDKRKDYSDAGCRGLTLAVLPNGSKLWFFRYRTADGRQRSLPLGCYNAKDEAERVSLADAHEAAADARKAVRDKRDPLAEKQQERDRAAVVARRVAEARSGEAPAPAAPSDKLTGDSLFVEIWTAFDSYMPEHYKPQTVAKWRGLYRRTLQGRWADKRLNQITADDIEAVIWALKATPDAADSLRVLCRVFFDWAVKARDKDGNALKLLPESPAEKVGKVERPKSRKVNNERALKDYEIRALWRATEGDPRFGNMLRLLLLTGARRNEVSESRWSEFNLAKGTWTIPTERSKSDRPHVVYLSAQALEVLNAIPRFDGTDFLFPTHGGETAISGFSKLKTKTDKAMAAALDGEAFEDWKLHDLRRSFSTGLARLGVIQTVAARCLNHSSGGKQTSLDKIYNVHDYAAEQASAWQRWGEHVAAVVKGDDSNVVPLVPLQVETVPA